MSDQETTMIQATFARLIRDGKLNVRQISRQTGIDDSGIYKWSTGTTEPKFTNIQQVFRAAGPDAQQAILALLTDGTRWDCFYTPTQADLDTNKDGTIDSHDAIASLAQSLGHSAIEVAEVNAALADGKITDDERARLSIINRQAISDLLTAEAVIAHIHAAQARRRKAKPIHTGGPDA